MISIRKEIEESIKLKIEEIISYKADEIILKSGLKGTYHHDNWQEKVSREFLEKSINGDIEIAEEKNMINFRNYWSPGKLKYLIEKIYPGKTINVSGHFHYPNTGFMSWHTNSDSPCTRLYINWCDEEGKSFFRYVDPYTKETVTDYDNKGINIREFDITDKPPYLWHCVGSECNRLSFGYRIT